MKGMRFLLFGLAAACGAAWAADAPEEAPAADAPRYETVPRTNGWHAAPAEAVASKPGALLHRWSFNGDLRDSVGGRDATHSGSSAYSWSADGKSVSLPGGPFGTSALFLGKDVVPTDGSPLTIEIWGTQRKAHDQGRIFELTSRQGQGFFSDFVEMTWSRNGNPERDEIWIWESDPNNWTNWTASSACSIFMTNDALAPYAIGTEYHVSFVVEPGKDGRTSVRFTKRDAKTGEILKQTSGFASGGWSPVRLAGREMWLGRASFRPGHDAAADYDEVRIWKAALTDGQLSESARLGPDVLPEIPVAATAGAKAAPWCKIVPSTKMRKDSKADAKAAASKPGVLLHRWSFNGDLRDSVGGRDATHSGSSAHSWSANGKAVSLPGGPYGTSALFLGKDVVPSDGSPLTIEIWGTQRNAHGQCRIFELTSRQGQGFFSDFVEMTWSRNSNPERDEIWIWESDPNNRTNWTASSACSIFMTNDALAPYAIGTEYHISLVAESAKNERTFVRFAKRDAKTGEILKQTSGFVSGGWSPVRLSGRELWLARSSFQPDNDAAADYDEVRIWKAALTDEQLSESARLGPDVLPQILAVATSGTKTDPPRYEIVPWTKGWQAAKADAEARGGHLATVTSAEEWETIRNLFPLRDLLGCWLGASDAEEEGVWRWVTGEPWGFTRWAPDQPDAMREGQDYLWLHVNFAGHWDDIEGDDPGATKYLLEREGPPISVSGLRQPFRLSPHVLLVEAAGGTNEVEVAAEGAWAAAERVPWISLKHAHGNGPGRLVLKVAANESPAKRSAKVRVRTTWDGEWRDIAVEQRGMEQVATPRVRSRGGTFEGPKQRVVLSCATEGASIRYTLDGSDPDGTSPLYAGSFNLSATATVKARAFKDGMLPSGPAEASFTRRTSLAEAIGMPEGIVSTDRFTGWRVEEGAGREGGPAAKSGAIGPEGRSRMEVRIEGAGTVAFWWKASCEDDLDGTGWDRVAFSVDGLEKAALDGESGWQRVEAEVKGEGVHVLAWEYAKDWIDEKPTADAAWVEGVSWRPATKRQVRSKE